MPESTNREAPKPRRLSGRVLVTAEMLDEVLRDELKHVLDGGQNHNPKGKTNA